MHYTRHQAKRPRQKRLDVTKREPSERTRALYDAREQKFSHMDSQGGTVSRQLRKRWNRKIKNANLRDYNEWLNRMADKMEMADKKGDSATIFKIVKIMSGLLTSSAQASPSTDKDGNLILDHDKLARKNPTGTHIGNLLKISVLD